MFTLKKLACLCLFHCLQLTANPPGLWLCAVGAGWWLPVPSDLTSSYPAWFGHYSRRTEVSCQSQMVPQHSQLCVLQNIKYRFVLLIVVYDVPKGMRVRVIVFCSLSSRDGGMGFKCPHDPGCSEVWQWGCLAEKVSPLGTSIRFIFNSEVLVAISPGPAICLLTSIHDTIQRERKAMLPNI